MPLPLAARKSATVDTIIVPPGKCLSSRGEPCARRRVTLSGAGTVCYGAAPPFNRSYTVFRVVSLCRGSLTCRDSRTGTAHARTRARCGTQMYALGLHIGWLHARYVDAHAPSSGRTRSSRSSGEISDRERVAVAAIGQHELALAVGAPKIVRRVWTRQPGPLGLVEDVKVDGLHGILLEARKASGRSTTCLATTSAEPRSCWWRCCGRRRHDRCSCSHAALTGSSSWRRPGSSNC